ncbi:uncharacterized protein JN550_012584 [Neoarthrinium moseri]|uniref:uncharacterized protein n=1 Tax=Neoarthrinium moseri TaxID=1658444 RepID=UPI001FDBD207|nr:uncharacterized protein JN550_012584 [Neoarthrinium moseri]KAI1858537.1 hypothetical protein JN550_012584 [Neoarthrinium moseri]
MSHYADDEDWTVILDKELRKRIQNRIAQRKHRIVPTSPSPQRSLFLLLTRAGQKLQQQTNTKGENTQSPSRNVSGSAPMAIAPGEATHMLTGDTHMLAGKQSFGDTSYTNVHEWRQQSTTGAENNLLPVFGSNWDTHVNYRQFEEGGCPSKTKTTDPHIEQNPINTIISRFKKPLSIPEQSPHCMSEHRYKTRDTVQSFDVDPASSQALSQFGLTSSKSANLEWPEQGRGDDGLMNIFDSLRLPKTISAHRKRASSVLDVDLGAPANDDLYECGLQKRHKIQSSPSVETLKIRNRPEYRLPGRSRTSSTGYIGSPTSKKTAGSDILREHGIDLLRLLEQASQATKRVTAQSSRGNSGPQCGNWPRTQANLLASYNAPAQDSIQSQNHQAQHGGSPMLAPKKQKTHVTKVVVIYSGGGGGMI